MPDDKLGMDPNAQQMPKNDMQGGTLSHATQGFVDILKHKAVECEYYKQAMQVHDHDGFKAVMDEEYKNCHERYHMWLQNAMKMFPGVDFAKLSSIGGEDEGEFNDDASEDNLPVSDDKKLMKSVSALSEDDWDELAVSLALAEIM